MKVWCANGPVWVFAYGSLMWDSVAPIAEAKAGRIEGWHRSLWLPPCRDEGPLKTPVLTRT